MGRVSRYKKIKACSAAAAGDLDDVARWGVGDNGRRKRKRSKTAERLRQRKGKRNDVTDDFDVPPEEDDFDINDLVGSIRKDKVEPSIVTTKTEPPTRRVCSIKSGLEASFQPLQRDAKDSNVEDAKFLKINKQLEQKQKQTILQTTPTQSLARQEGESKRAFRRRVQTVTQISIAQSQAASVNPEKRRKRKEFLIKKKRKRRKGMSAAGDFADETGDAVPITTGPDKLAMAEQALESDTPRFGEQAERPPIFRHIPRGAKRKKQHNADELELLRRQAQLRYAAVRTQRMQKQQS